MPRRRYLCKHLKPQMLPLYGLSAALFDEPVPKFAKIAKPDESSAVNVQRTWKMDVQHPSSIARLTLHVPSHNKRVAIGAVFVVLYAFAGQWCYETAGEPLAQALKEIAEKDALKNATLALSNATGSNNTTSVQSTEDLLAELAEIEAEPRHDANETDPNKLMTTPKPLPGPYLPNAWAGALMFLICTSTALFFLMGIWLVWFKTMSLYNPATRVTEDCYVHIHTHAHKGKQELCKLETSSEWPCR